MNGEAPKASIKELGRLVQRHRHTAGLSLEKLAARSGVDRSTISRIEHGRFGSPSPQTLQRLSGALGTNVEDYLALAGHYSLPSLGVYLRTKYDVSPELAREVEDYFAWRRAREADDKPNEQQEDDAAA